MHGPRSLKDLGRSASRRPHRAQSSEAPLKSWFLLRSPSRPAVSLPSRPERILINILHTAESSLI